nr:GDSL esterase/lipase At5g37690-like [Setaria viridis]
MEGFVLFLVISMEVLGAAAGVLLPPPMYVFGDSRAAKKIGLAGSPPPYLALAWSSSLVVSTALTIGGVSYASGGAGILDSTNAGNNIPLSKQVQYFNATRSKMIAAVGSGAVNTLLSRSVVLIGAGGNDLGTFYRSPPEQQSDVATFYGSLMSNYSAAITDLYTLGARKFAITNLGLVGCLPVNGVLDTAGACSDLRNQLGAGFNDAVRNMLADLAARLPGFRYSLGDASGLMVDTFADPPASGFTDVAGECCGGDQRVDCSPNSTVCANRDHYYFWDAVHISQEAAKQRAEAFYDGPAKYTTPINFKQLVWST